MARILVWFPTGFFPPRMGSQVRALELLRALGSTGHEIHLATGWNPPGSGMGWPRESVQAVEALGIARIHVHRSLVDDVLEWAMKRSGKTDSVAKIGSWSYTLPMQTRWFAKLVRQLSPDLLIMNYSVSDPMVEASGFDRKRCVLETHDLVILNKELQARLKQRLPRAPYSPDEVDPEIIDLDWYRKFNLDSADEEAALCARYGLCFSISSREGERIKGLGGNVVHLPMSIPCGREGNTWSGNALFAAGPNSFNIQGYLWFVAKVLPKLLAKEPGFRLDVSGTLSSKLAPIVGVNSLGLVPDLGEIYLRSRLAICPVFGGTGQQVKIVEAMAWGVPVVSLASPARESPLVHGVNGFVCADEEEFAESCLLLWRDKALRERMGKAARETVSRELSPSVYADRIKESLLSTFPDLRPVRG